MNQHFVDRKEELEFLEKFYKKREGSLIIIYGRRRVGKTELIKNFIASKNSIYYLCERQPIQKNVEKFKEIVAEKLGEEWLKDISVRDFESVFKAVERRLKKEKIVVVFDEFPYLIEMDRGIVSHFQKIWDEILKNTNVLLILCGSSIGMMETEVLGYKSPLHGRRSAQWKLTELEIKFLKDFLPSYDFESILYTYSILGGIPLYLLKFDAGKSVFENVKEQFLWKGGFLYEEAENLLRQEFREPRNYMLILRAIAEGKRKLGEISNETGLDKSAVSRYLDTLETVKFVDYELPVTEPSKSKKRLYYLSDNYLNFWFKFIYPNKWLIEEGFGERVLEKIKSEFSRFFSGTFERLCRKIVLSRFDFTRVGKQWGRIPGSREVYEIDIVALNEKTKKILFAECKWQRKVNARKICKELAEKSQYVQWHNDKRKEGFAIFAKSFSKRINEFEGRKVYCFDLRDMEKVIKNHHDNMKTLLL